MLARLVALLVAAAMVAGGWYVRSLRSPVAPGSVAADDGGPVQILCDAALGAVCDSVNESLDSADASVHIEPAGDSYTRLSTLDERRTATESGATRPDVWLTLAPWPQMVDGARERAGLEALFAAESAALLAASPLVLVAWADRGQVLADHCGVDTLTWTCAAGTAGSTWAELGGEITWGPVKPGIPDPSASSDGLSVLAQATQEQLGTNEFGSRSLSDGAYLDWLTALTDAVPDFAPTSGSPLAAMVAIGPASFDVVGATEAATATALAGAGRADQLRVHYPDPVVAVDAVAASAATADELDVETSTAFTDALATASWRTGEVVPDAVSALHPPAGAAVDLSEAAGADLPAPGALEALRSTFVELTP